MQISDYNYHLPNQQIATHPPAKRGDSQLLVLNRADGSIEHKRYSDIATYMGAGDLLVINDSRVIKARLIAHNKQGQSRELLLLESHHTSPDPKRRLVIYRGRLQAGETLRVGTDQVVVSYIEGHGIAEITADSHILSLADKWGSTPLPPYLGRPSTTEDTARYQSVFASRPGSVAAPTASLNFTDQLRASLVAKGVIIAPLTLHVGLGTFLPIRSDDITEHVMHSEYFQIPSSTIELIRQTKAQGRKLTALGTTVTRCLEFAQQSILQSGAPKSISGEADIFIYPGYNFQLVDQLITNFHAPRSTVLMLAAAFAGWTQLQAAYQAAIAHNYRFLSYGDSMLIK